MSEDQLLSKEKNLSGETASLEYLFEPLKAEDINTCIDIIMKVLGEQRLNRDSVKHTLKDPNFITLVARGKGKIVGVINGVLPPSLVQAPKIIFVGVVDQESIIKGLAGMLIDNFISELKRRSPKTPYVDVNLASKDTNAVALYSSKGFSVEGFVKDGLSGADIVILRKRILTQEASKTPIA